MCRWCRSLLFASGLPEPYKLFQHPLTGPFRLKDGKRDSAYNSRLIRAGDARRRAGWQPP
ncbi:MAG: hypothetical protein U0792_21615 [Gemmataceae bacterium]